MHRFAGLLALATWLISGCTYQIASNPEYVPEERPPFIAQGRILIVLPQTQQAFTYQGSPTSTVGDYTTMIVPMGDIVRGIAEQVFGSCFAHGIVFAENRFVEEEHVIALEGDMQEFVYSYTRIIDSGFSEEDPDVWIVPEVDIAFHVRAYDSRGQLILDDTYDSGVTAGERYRTTSRPAERINQALHATLHELMLQVANDIRPLLIGECTIEDLEPIA
ncbi:MAG TPA: hypothetical protein VGC50_01035 [Gammaproteobacteria bacterium]|jgi:hypothetical protein